MGASGFFLVPPYTSSEFWINLQTRYDLDLADRTVRRQIEQEISPRAA
jgi:plasmid maintenance system antidote protein VapI